MQNFQVTKISEGGREELIVPVTTEIPFTINLNNQELVTLLCGPQDLKELSVGFLFTSGLMLSYKEIKSIVVDEKSWVCNVETQDKEKDKDLIFKRMYTSGCGRGAIIYNALDAMHKQRISSEFKIPAKKIIALTKELQAGSGEYRETHGVHSAALADNRKILLFIDDIGRHNAIDKIIGAALIQNIDFSDKIILSTGRISSEIIFKIQKCRLPIIVSKSAPTDQACKLAKSLNITLIGLVRGSSMNVYSAEERII